MYTLRSAGVSDLVRNDYNGFLTEQDLDVFAAKIVDILDKMEDLKGLSENALHSALEYRKEAVARSAVRLYNGVITGKTPVNVLLYNS